MFEQQDEGEEATMGCLKLLNALKGKPTTHQAGDRSFMHVEGHINAKTTQLMVDTCASHNFASPVEA